MQNVWYLGLIYFVGGISPVRFLKGSLDVVASTFSTASTAATMPITLNALTSKLGVSHESSHHAACIGTNFNNDGTALYQATAVLFMAQAMGYSLGPTDQLIIVVTTLVASVGAGGIPEGSFVTLPLRGEQADNEWPGQDVRLSIAVMIESRRDLFYVATRVQLQCLPEVFVPRHFRASRIAVDRLRRGSNLLADVPHAWPAGLLPESEEGDPARRWSRTVPTFLERQRLHDERRGRQPPALLVPLVLSTPSPTTARSGSTTTPGVLSPCRASAALHPTTEPAG